MKLSSGPINDQQSTHIYTDPTTSALCGGGGGGGGGFSPQGPAQQQPQQPIPQAIDIKVGGKLPTVFDSDHTKADKFINEVKAYLHHNKDVAGFNSPMKKVTFTLTLMQGDKVDGWCETMGDFLDGLEDHHNIPALWTFFLQLQYSRTNSKTLKPIKRPV